MKWSVVMLLGLGLVAALCAAILVAGLSGSGARARTSQQSADNAKITVLRASKDMAPMAIVDGTCITEYETTRDKVPGNALTSPVEVVGKVLSLKMVKDQVFTTGVFAAEGSGTKVTATIPKGKRAIGVAIANYASLDGILYPGASVDVLGSFRAVGNSGSPDYREPISVTLLEGVEVLAIERNTVVSQEIGANADSDGTTTRGQAARRVTMLVTPQQGKILQLAMEQGTLSLALRNPTDMEPASREGVPLSSLINPDESPSRRDFEEALRAMRSKDPFATTNNAAPAPMTPRRNTWDTVIMRGAASETVHFAVPGEAGGSSN